MKRNGASRGSNETERNETEPNEPEQNLMKREETERSATTTENTANRNGMKLIERNVTKHRNGTQEERDGKE